MDKPYPQLTCINCGETKSALRFPKRGGPTYENVSVLEPRRYDRQCKKCKKAKRPGQTEVKEPRMLSQVRKGMSNTSTIKRRSKPKLSPAEYRAKVRDETRIKSMIYLSEKGCEDCGERDPRVLEYDHKNPADKKHHIARLITHGYSWTSPVLRAEIRKCRVLCANCHRLHTIKSQGYYAGDEVQRTLGQLAARYGIEL